MKFLIATVAGLITGVITGAGIGGGTLLVFYMTCIAGIEQVAAQGVNLLYFLVSAPAALVGHFKNRLIELRPGIVAAVFGSAFALGASLLSRGLDDKILGKIFGVLFIVVGVKELLAKKENEKN